MSAEYGTYHLAAHPAAYQPVRTNNFRFIADGLAELIKANANTELVNISDEYVTNAKEVLEFSVVSFNAPHFTQKEIEVARGNSKVYFASVPEFKDGSLVINDFAGANGKSTLEAWQALSYDVLNDTIPSSDKYKVNAMVLEYLPDDTLLRYWELIGCWVKGLDESGWDNEKSDKKTVTATIRYDRAIPHQADELYSE